MPRTLRPLWPAAAALAPVLFAASLLGGDRTLAWRDTARILAPVRAFVVEALRHGRLPLWNPYSGAGAPLFGDAIHGVLHPVSLVAAALSGGVDLLILLYVAAAGLGAWLAARALGASPAAAAVAGIGYGASGAVLGTTSLVQCMSGAATFPWVVAAARQTGLGRRLALPALALAAAAMVLGGDLQGTVVAGAAALIVAADAGGPRCAARAAGGLALGILVAGVQIVPTWALMERSLRVYDLDATTAHQWALQPWRVLELVLPGLVGGRPGPTFVAGFMALQPDGRFSMPFLPSTLVGLPLIVAATQGVGARTGRLLAISALALLWLALGHTLGAQQALSWVPVWKSFRYAEKLVPYLTLVVALLAALGLDALTASPQARRRAFWSTLGLALVAAVGVEAFIRTVAPRASSPEATRQIAANAALGLLLLGGFALATLAALAVAGRRPAFAPATFVALVALHAAVGSRFALLAIPDMAAVRPPLLAAPPPGPRLTTPRIFESAQPLDPGAIAEHHTLEATAGAAVHNVRARIDNIDTAGALISRRFELLWTELGEERWRSFRRFGVTHVGLRRPLNERARTIARSAVEAGTLVAEAGEIRFFEVPHRPWAFFASAARAVSSQRETLAATREAIERDDPAVVLEGRAAPALAPGRVLTIDRAAERVVIDAEADGDGLLVVNDAYFPGWTATIDNNPTEILPADVLMRAIPFPKGRHRLEMRYAPQEVPRGIALSLLGTLACTAVALHDRRRSRNRLDEGAPG